ncbi:MULTISPECIES: energy-coupling factor transporter transmembrane component T family protein [unclassified Coleofasciculus]|uniref:energy-coupling factor transporter transmembrane component T family protein n=1 Tax=unclassified Coleofasciculus TaxID=2692782 RepID=UPI0018818E17|nr:MULTISPECIES: energy-coupling factor transporter transmembrane protein EcfT [unclassified Coleofasciculus]MBE9124711.1 energy-coupling factor transporter transmembrane protein EcfT [Coleofasciculus sp. LEGE 07081]MBE9147038.1 energy-coupling factor transporter transmembrane protein EcfT [Coleofasciculus sp. LEGE 07092]
MDLLRSLPLGLYLEQPITWLHYLDSRVKFIWLMSFLAAPLLANPFSRLALVVLLILLTLSARIPLRVWRQQMGWLLTLSFFVFVLTAIAPDGLALNHQSRLPPNELTFSEQSPTQTAPAPNPWYNPFGWRSHSSDSSLTQPPSLRPQPTDYRYVLFSAGPVTITRRSLDLAVRVSTVLFTLIYSTNLFLLTTAPEEITAGLESLMRPLRRLKVPVTEITLTLTLSLRFIPLVLEEVQNLFRSVRTRAINWKKLGVRRSLQVWLIVSERLLENLLLRAEQIAKAMTVRGFTSPNEHRVQWHQLRLRRCDWLAIASLIVFWGARLAWG